MAKSVYTKDERKGQFLATGIKLAKKNGLAKVSVSAVAAEHKVTAPLIFHIFGNRAKFHAAIKAAARKQGVQLPKDAKAAPARKRSVKEVKAIKDKGAKGKGATVGKPAAKKAAGTAAKPAPSRTRGSKAVTVPKAAKTVNVPKVAKSVTKPKAAKSVTVPKPFATMPAPSTESVGTNLTPKV